MSNAKCEKHAAPLAIEYINRTSLIPDPSNARKHPPAQIVRLEAAVREFGLTVPIIIDEGQNVIAGHARLMVAESLGIESIPCVRIAHLTVAQKRALAIADNRIAELAEWDSETLRTEFAALCKLEFPVELTGFATAEIDLILDCSVPGEVAPPDPADIVHEPDRSAAAVSRRGDLWLLGDHRLVCGDALDVLAYEALLGERQASMAITDPRYKVPIPGHVSGLGATKHRAFATASDEMSPEEFTAFLTAAMLLMARFSTDGSLQFHFVDHRHLIEMTTAGLKAYVEQKTVCVWVKPIGGKGSLYRSRHELVFVFKNGAAPHQNNIQLGKYGRYRTDVWEYASFNSFRPTHDSDLAAHPTVKPVAMIADAIRDCSKRGDIILDPFAGSGTILLAAERTGRKAATIELDPHYVDTAVRRWQQATGKRASLSATGETFDGLSKLRALASHKRPDEPTVGGNDHD